MNFPEIVLSSFLSTARNHETHLNPEMANDTQAIGDLAVTNYLENPSGDSVTSPDSSKESTRKKARRLSGPRVRGRGLKKRKVSAADGIPFSEETQDQNGGRTEEEHCEDQTTTNLDAARETQLTPTVPEQGGADTELDVQTCADTHCTDSDGKLDRDCSLDAPTSDCPSPVEESSKTLSLPKAKRGRRSSVNPSVLQEQRNQTEECQTSHEVEEKGQEDQAASQQENHTWSSSDTQEKGGVATLDLAPWQADFDFEDVFKPVTTRGQRSVRRSLRNQSNAENNCNSTGLAWLPRNSPDSSKVARRKTRGRRLSAAPPVQHPLPEDTEDNAS